MPYSKRYSSAGTTSRGHPPVGRQWGHWFAGLVDGEGSFVIRLTRGQAPSTLFELTLRADDEAILQEIHQQLGIGKLYGPYLYAEGKRRPTLSYRVQTIKECQVLVRVFRAFPLRSKKARCFELWAKAVRLRTFRKGSRYGRVSEVRKAALFTLYEQLKAANGYNCL
jgi:hypothetical protein